MGSCSSETINLVAWQSRTCVRVVVRVFVLRVALHRFLPYAQDINDPTMSPESAVNLCSIDTTVIII